MAFLFLIKYFIYVTNHWNAL